MIDIGYLVIIAFFLIYYFMVLIIERKIIEEPKEIIDKFLSMILLYAGISIIYFSLIGRPFLSNTEDTYSVYLFIIGFIAVLWTVPNLMSEFSFFRKFLKKGQRREKIKGKKREMRKI